MFTAPDALSTQRSSTICSAMARQVRREHRAQLTRTRLKRSYVRNIDESVVTRGVATTIPAPQWLVEATAGRPGAVIIPSALAAKL